MSMMRDVPRMEGLVPANESEDREYIQRCVAIAQQKMNESAFLIDDRARGDYSGCLIELEKRMQDRLDAKQFKLFIEMRKERNAFPWPPVDVNE